MLDVMAAAREACEKAAIADVSLAGPREVMAACLEIERARASLEAAELHLLARLEAEGITDREAGHKTAPWVAALTGAAVSSINARVKRARHLRRVPEVDAAYAAGDITADHVGQFTWAAAIDRIADQLDAVVAEFLPKAKDRRVPFRQWRHALGRRVDELDQDGPFDPDRELARNSLTCTTVEPGVVRFSGQLAGERAEAFTQALHAKTDRLYRRFHRDHQHTSDVAVPSRATLQALALAELVADGQHGEATSGRVIDITLVAHADLPGQLFTPDGSPLPPEATAALHCCGEYTPIVVGSDGVPLFLGRTQRFATPALRRALTIRDGGCTFDGCDAPASRTEVHHVIPWEHGGTTDPAHNALVCPHHHEVTHRQGWTMTANPDQTFTWTTPSADVIHSQRHGRPTKPERD